MSEHGRDVDHQTGVGDRAAFEDVVQQLGDGGARRDDVVAEQLGERP